PALRIPVVPEGRVHGYQAYVCLYAPQDPIPTNVEALSRERDDLMARLERQGIATRQGTHAPTSPRYYPGKHPTRPTGSPNALAAERLTVALPLFPQMTDEEQAQVVEALRDV